MSSKDNPSRPGEKEKRNSLLGWFVSREEPDKDYVPELQSQWASLDIAGRIKFLIGALIGAILFFGALYAVYIILLALAG